jgi:hypothetical protein
MPSGDKMNQSRDDSSAWEFYVDSFLLEFHNDDDGSQSPSAAPKKIHFNSTIIEALMRKNFSVAESDAKTK